MNRRDMRNAGQGRRLRGDPMGSSGMGMDDVNSIGANEPCDPQGIQNAEGKSLPVDRDGPIGLTMKEPVGYPKDRVLAAPGFF